MRDVRVDLQDCNGVVLGRLDLTIQEAIVAIRGRRFRMPSGDWPYEDAGRNHLTVTVKDMESVRGHPQFDAVA